MKNLRVILPWVTLCILLGCSTNDIIFHPCTQEYVAGQGNIKGNVDLDYFLEFDEELEIGATTEGYAAFKDPERAWDIFIEKCSDEIEMIQKENGLDPLTFENMREYLKVSMLNYDTTEETQEQITFVGRFLDIYENSLIR